MRQHEPWTSLEKRKIQKSVETANNLLNMELEVGFVGQHIFLVEDGRRFATLGTFSELDALLAGISCGERGGEKSSCTSFSSLEWDYFIRGYLYGKSLRKG